MASLNHVIGSKCSVQVSLALNLSDIVIGVFLFLATSCFVLWQNAHITILYDLSYNLENATRISLGQIPYRDFPFPYAPLPFLVQASIIKLFGRVVLYHYAYAAVSSALATLLTWRIVLRLLVSSRMPPRLTSFLLAVPLIPLGTCSIYPHQGYDADCTLFILLCIWLLLRVESADFPAFGTFACGFMLAVPFLAKQNTGGAFLFAAVICIVFFGLRNRRASVLLITGVTTGLACGLALIQYIAGVSNYLRWTIHFAASRRLPGLRVMLGIYWHPALLWIIVVIAFCIAYFLIRPAARPSTLWFASGFLCVPFLWAAAAFSSHTYVADRLAAFLRIWPLLLITSLAVALWQLSGATRLGQLISLILLGTVNGALLSQQVGGSTYALWPILVILIAAILVALSPNERQFPRCNDSQFSTVPLIVFAGVASTVLLVIGSYYALSHTRLEFADLSGDGLMHSSLPALRGLAMRGRWVSQFEELVAYADRDIPIGDAILMLPDEDVFYFTTGRTPRFPVLVMDTTANPYGPVQIAQLVRQCNVRWVVAKRKLQIYNEQVPSSFYPELMNLLYHDFELTKSLENYDIYRRRQE
jgi:hypothetical protein